jgi:hypothetical protein
MFGPGGEKNLTTKGTKVHEVGPEHPTFVKLEEPDFLSFRMSSMDLCIQRMAALVFLLAACGLALTQNTPAPLDLKPDATGAVPPEQIRELLRRAEEKDLENDKRQRDYTYVERDEEHHLDGHGGVKKIESRSSEVLEIYGEPVERLTAKNDKPLSAGEAKKEDDKIQKIIDKRKNESEDDRRKRLAREEKDREEDRKFVLEIADAFNFRLIGSEAIDGRDAWVFEGEPRPGYEPKQRNARMLSKFKGRVWIDRADSQWVKLDITAIDTLSIGFVLARIHKGTHFVIELTRVNDEVWLPKRVQLHIDARVALFKSYDEDVEQTYRDYKKFQTDTKITVGGEETRP